MLKIFGSTNKIIFLGTYGWSCINEFHFMVHLICLSSFLAVEISIKFKSRDLIGCI